MSAMAAYNTHLRQAAVANAECLGMEGNAEEEDEEAEEGAGDGEGEDDYYVVPATGARVGLVSALNLLGKYVAKLPGRRRVHAQPPGVPPGVPGRWRRRARDRLPAVCGCGAARDRLGGQQQAPCQGVRGAGGVPRSVPSWGAG